MPDEISIDKALGIVRINSYGLVSKSDIAESIAKVSRIFEVEGISKIIVDTTRQDSAPSTTSIYDLFSTFPSHLMAAILVHASQPTVEDQRFIELVSMNRGKLIRLFTSEKEAMAWLGKTHH